MADTKITALTPLAGADVASTDPLPIVDVSDLTMASSGTTKRINAKELSNYVLSSLSAGIGVSIASVAGSTVVSLSGLITDTFTAGASITYGQVCYIAADGLVYPARTDSATTSSVVGVAVSNASTSDTVVLSTCNKLMGLSGLTAGTEYFASATSAGSIVTYPTLAATSGAQIVSLGYARSSTELHLNITRRGVTP